MHQGANCAYKRGFKITKKVIVLIFLRAFNLIAADIRIIRFAACWYSILTLTLTQAVRDFGLYLNIIEDCTNALKDSFQAEETQLCCYNVHTTQH